HRVCEVLAAVLEVTEGPHELRPVGDQHRLVQRALGRFPEEPDGVGTDGLDRLGSAIDFLDIDARGQITRCHSLVLLVPADGGGLRPPIGSPRVPHARRGITHAHFLPVPPPRSSRRAARNGLPLGPTSVTRGSVIDLYSSRRDWTRLNSSSFSGRIGIAV